MNEPSLRYEFDITGHYDCFTRNNPLGYTPENSSSSSMSSNNTSLVQNAHANASANPLRPQPDPTNWEFSANNTDLFGTGIQESMIHPTHNSTSHPTPTPQRPVESRTRRLAMGNGSEIPPQTPNTPAASLAAAHSRQHSVSEPRYTHQAYDIEARNASYAAPNERLNPIPELSNEEIQELQSLANSHAGSEPTPQIPCSMETPENRRTLPLYQSPADMNQSCHPPPVQQTPRNRSVHFAQQNAPCTLDIPQQFYGVHHAHQTAAPVSAPHSVYHQPPLSTGQIPAVNPYINSTTLHNADNRPGNFRRQSTVPLPTHQPHTQSYMPQQAYHAYAPNPENANVTALITQRQDFEAEQRRLDREASLTERAFEAEQRRLEREATQRQNAFEAEQRRLDREANQTAMLSMADQLRDTQLNISRNTGKQALTQKTANLVRINPPPKFQKGDNLIVHFRTKVESHLREYYNHSRDEQILALGHVFPTNEDRKIKAREIAQEMLPSEPTTVNDRLPTYRAIVEKFGEDTYSGEFTALSTSEDISNFFKRTRILVEETLTSDVNQANARTLQLMKDRKKQLIPIRLMSTLDTIILSTLPITWKKGVSSELIEVVLRVLEETRDNLVISDKQVNHVSTTNQYSNHAQKPNHFQSSAPRANFQQTAPIAQRANAPAPQNPINLSSTIPSDQTWICYHCRRNDNQNRTHVIRDCPAKHLCGYCLTFRYNGKSAYAKNISNIPTAYACQSHASLNKKSGKYNANGIRIIHAKKQVHNVHHEMFPTPTSSVKNFVIDNGVNTLESSVAHVNFTQGFLHKAPTPDEFDTGNIYPVTDPTGQYEIPLFCNLSRMHDKFHYLVPQIINGNGDKVDFPMVVDTGCNADGVISQNYIDTYNLSSFVNHQRYASVSVANGNTQRCKTLNLSIPLPSKSVDLSLIILDQCPAGALIGLPGCKKIDPNAISSLMSRLNMSFRPTKN